MSYPENKSRYLLLPDFNKDGECVMVDVIHIRAITKLEPKIMRQLTPTRAM